MKLLTQNLYHGLRSPYTREIDKARMENAQRIVDHEDPEFVALVEAYYGMPNETGLLTDYRELFGFPFMAYCAKSPHSYAGNCLLSKYPIISATLTKLDLRNSLSAEIDIGKPLHIDVVHPYPFIEEEQKIEGIRPLLERRRAPYLLTGDMNALSDEDEYDEGQFILAFRKFTKQPGDSEALRFLERKVVPFIKSYGLVDAMPLHRRTYTIPSDFASAQKESGMRIDFCFASPDIEIVDGYVLQDGIAEHVSDHRGIVTIFNP
jgi:endonuclease/exonuclease/phosphatase family metal-dependent hydrolase